MADRPLYINIHSHRTKEPRGIALRAGDQVPLRFTLTLILSLGLPLRSTKNGLPVPTSNRCPAGPEGCLKCFRMATDGLIVCKIIARSSVVSRPCFTESLQESEYKSKSISRTAPKPPLHFYGSNPKAHPPSHSPAFSCSSLRTRSAGSGKRDSHPYCSLNRANGRAGVPQTVWPRRILLPLGMPACAPMIASSSSVQCGAMPTCPPISTCAPMVQLPEIPTCAATTEFLPI